MKKETIYLALAALLVAAPALAGNLSTKVEMGAGASYSRSHEGVESIHPVCSLWTVTALSGPSTVAGHIAYDMANGHGTASIGPRLAVADGQDGSMVIGADATFVLGHGGASSWEAVAELSSGPWHMQGAYEPSTKTQRYTAGVRVALP